MKYHKGGQAPWYVTRGKRPRRRGGGEGGNFFSFFSLTPSLSRVSPLFRDSIADPRNYFCRLPVFNCHLRLKVESGDDAELFDRTTAGGRSSFVDPRSNPGTNGKRVRERESKKRKRRNFLPLLLLDVGTFPARDVPRRPL